LAWECGKDEQTIKKWESEGKFPRAPFLGRLGARLYAQEHIAVTVALLLKENMRIGASPNFTKKIAAAFAALTIDKLEHISNENQRATIQ
jgi:hypothetical protein